MVNASSSCLAVYVCILFWIGHTTPVFVYKVFNLERMQNDIVMPSFRPLSRVVVGSRDCVAAFTQVVVVSPGNLASLQGPESGDCGTTCY